MLYVKQTDLVLLYYLYSHIYHLKYSSTIIFLTLQKRKSLELIILVNPQHIKIVVAAILCSNVIVVCNFHQLRLRTLSQLTHFGTKELKISNSGATLPHRQPRQTYNIPYYLRWGLKINREHNYYSKEFISSIIILKRFIIRLWVGSRR